MRLKFNRPEKALFLTPLIPLAVMGILYWKKSQTISIPFTEDIHLAFIKFSPDSKRLAVLGRSRTYGIYDVATNEKLCDVEEPSKRSKFNPPYWSPDSENLIATTYDQNGNLKILRWNTGDGKLGATWNFPSPAIPLENRLLEMRALHTSVAYASKAQTFASTGYPVTLFDARTGAILKSFETKASVRSLNNLPGYVEPFLFNPKQTQIASVTDGVVPREEHVEIHESRTGKLLWKPAAKSVERMEWAANGVLCILEDTSYPSSQVWFWDSEKRQHSVLPLVSLPIVVRVCPTEPLVALVFPPKPTPANSKTQQFRLELWNYQTQKLLWSRPLENATTSLQWSPNGIWLSFTEMVDHQIKGPGSHNLYLLDRQGNTHHQSFHAEMSPLIWSPDSLKIAFTTKNSIEIMRIH